MTHVHGVATGSSTSVKVEGLSLFVSVEDQVEVPAIIMRHCIGLENEIELTDESKRYLASREDEVSDQ